MQAGEFRLKPTFHSGRKVNRRIEIRIIFITEHIVYKPFKRTFSQIAGPEPIASYPQIQARLLTYPVFRTEIRSHHN